MIITNYLITIKYDLTFSIGIRLKTSVNNLRPTVKEKTSWDIESSYVNNGNKEVIRIKLSSEKRPHNYHSSDLFICKANDINESCKEQ